MKNKEQKKLPCRCGKRGAQCMVHYPPFPVKICGNLIHASAGQYCAESKPCKWHDSTESATECKCGNKIIGTSSGKCDDCMFIRKTSFGEKSSPTKPDTTELKLNKDVIIDHGKHCKCDNCKAFYKPDHIVQTDKMVPEEWEKEFYNKFYKGIAIINYEPEHEDYQSLSLIEIEDFIRQEKEKSYVEGAKDERKYLLNQKANNHDQQVRAVLLEEIIERVEEMNQPIRHSDECLAQTENDKYCDCGLRTYLEGHDSALKSVLSRLKEKLTQK